jgi:iron(III) transport system substrate-binding protein
LAEHHLLATLPKTTMAKVPAADSSPHDQWVGVALRVNVLVYNPSLISASQLPSSLLDLAGAQWSGKVAIAPTDSDFLPLVGAVSETQGQSAALSWLQGLKRNALTYQDDESVVAAVNRGAVATGIINQYYWYRLQLEVGSGGMHSAVYSFPSTDVGAVANISGAAVLASSQRKSAANAFVAFLVSAQAQQLIARGDDFEYPLRPGVEPNTALPALDTLHPMAVNVVGLGNDQEAAKLLQQAGLA